MSFLSGLLGNASESDGEDLADAFLASLVPGEEVVKVFKVLRDSIVFTTKRIVFVDRQGVTGKKADYYSVPYRSVDAFSMETRGPLDLDADLTIWVKGAATPIVKRFRDDRLVADVYRLLSLHTLG